MKHVAIVLGTSRSDGNTRKLISLIENKLENRRVGCRLFILNEFQISPFDYEHKNLNDDFLPMIHQLLSY